MVIPNFERDRFEGQMNPAERELLYNTVMSAQPDVVCEVGTCRGGGSTYFISSALRNLGKGKLYTCEDFKEFYDYARALYAGNPDFAGLEQYIEFFFGDSERAFKDFKLPVNVCLLDGGADSIKMVYDFTLFRPLMPIGSYLIMHDWDNGKTDYIKQILIADAFDWQFEKQALALVVYKRIADVHEHHS